MSCLLAIFVLLVASVISESSALDLPQRSRKGVCTITEEELKDMRVTIMEMYSEKDFGAISGCDQIISNTVECAGSLKSFLKQKLENTEVEYNRTKETLQQKEDAMMLEFDQTSEMMRKSHKKAFEALGNKIGRLKKLIDDLTIEKEKYLADLIIYNDYLKGGTQFTSRFDDDSFFETAKKCSIRRNMVSKLISEFNQIFLLLVGNPNRISLLDDCFEALRHQIATIDNIVAHKTTENVIESLRATYEVRARNLRKTIDDYNLQARQEINQNASSTTDELSRLRKQFNELKTEVASLKEETYGKTFEVIAKLVQSGSKLIKARDLYIKIINASPNERTYEDALEKIYNCDENNLYHALRFVQVISFHEGYKIITAKMKKCGHINCPFILKIAYSFNDDSLEENVQEVYLGWLSQIRQKKYTKIHDFYQRLEVREMNFPKFFQIALADDVGNAKHILDMIDSFHATYQNMVTDLYDKMIEMNLVNTYEFVQLADWISGKLSWIRKQPTYSPTVGRLQPYLEGLRDKLPNGVKVFAFEPELIIAMKDDEYLLRSENYNSVKFKISNRTGKFYRFEDFRFGKSFHATNVQASNNNNAIFVRLGTGNDDGYYWEVTPTDNAKFFYLKNKQHGVYLSSEEDNVCLKKGFFGGCSTKEWMNRAHSTNNSPSTKWTFTTRLVRNADLPARNQG